MMSGRSISVLRYGAIRLVTATVLATAIAGCGSIRAPSDREVINTEHYPSPTTSPVDPAAEESPMPPKAEVARDRAMAAYRAMWADLLAAGRTSAWNSPRLDDHATGDALAELSRRLHANHSKGLVAKGKVDQDPVARTEYGRPRVVLINDCVNDLKWQTYEADTGDIVDGARGRHWVKAFVRLQDDGTWKVSYFWMDEISTC